VVRRVGFVLAALVVLVVFMVLAEWALERRLDSRFREFLARQTSRAGTFASVDVCLPCASYTIHGVDLKSPGPDGPRPLLEASAVDFGLVWAELWRGELRGEIVLHDAALHVGIDDRGSDGDGEDANVFSIQWDRIGRGLWPTPVTRIVANGSEIYVDYDRFREPILWRFEVHRGLADRLANGDGELPRVRLRGETPGGGEFELKLDVHPAEGRSKLDGRLRAVPLAELETYVRHRAGVDVESGSLTAVIDLEATRSGWTGHVDCRIVDLEIFQASDVIEHGPVQALKDAVAGLMVSIDDSSDGVLEMRLDVDERARDAGDEWAVLADVVEWLLLAPFQAPFRLIPTSPID
jgi:hypothetical protein